MAEEDAGGTSSGGAGTGDVAPETPKKTKKSKVSIKSPKGKDKDKAAAVGGLVGEHDELLSPKRRKSSSKSKIRASGLSPIPTMKPKVKVKKPSSTSTSSSSSSKKKSSSSKSSSSSSSSKRKSSKPSSSSSSKKKSKKSSSSSSSSKKKIKDDGHFIAIVYKNDPTSLSAITNLDSNIVYGIWQRPAYSIVQSPQEVWMYELSDTLKKIPQMEKSKNIIHGVWGHPTTPSDEEGTIGIGTDAPKKKEVIKGQSPNQLWFYTPNDDLPPFFQPCGYWTVPLVTGVRDQIAPNSVGFVNLGAGHHDGQQQDKLDVEGEWKLLYQRADPFQKKDKPQGPGMSTKRKKMKPMTIYVMYPNGTTSFPLTGITPKTTIYGIKQRISEHEEIPIAQEHLFFKDQELITNSATLKSCNISDGDTIHLDGMKITVIVQTIADGKETSYRVGINPMLSILKLKQRVQKRTGILPENQYLIHDDVPMKDDTNTMEECNILHNDIVYVKTEDIIQQVYVKIPDGQILTIPFQPKDTLKDLKQKLQVKTGVPVVDQRIEKNNHTFHSEEYNDEILKSCGIVHGDTIDLKAGMALNIHTPMKDDGSNGEIHSIDFLKPNDTIQYVKEKIQQRIGIPLEEQHLFFNNKELTNVNSTLTECNLEHDDDIELSTMRINIKMPDELIIPIDCKPIDTVLDIKKKIEFKTTMKVNEQRLLKDDNEDDSEELIELTKLITSYGVQHGDTLNLQGMVVNVKTPEGTIVPVSCKPTDTVQIFKQKVQEETGVPLFVQILSKPSLPSDDNDDAAGGGGGTGEILNDDTKTLEEFGIQHKSDLDLDRFQIFIQPKDEKEHPIAIYCSPNDTIEEIKRKIKDKTGIPIDEQMLQSPPKGDDNNNKEFIDPKMTLTDAGIQKGDTLPLDRMSITVTPADGKPSISIYCGPNDTVQDIKHKIEKETDIPLDEQIVKTPGGVVMDDPKATLQDLGIKDKDDLKLDRMTITVKKPDGKLVMLNVAPSDTIKDIKDKLETKLGNGQPLGPEHKLMYNGKDLLDPDTEDDQDHTTLDDLGIKNGDTLGLKDGTMTIYVNTPAGGVVPIQGCKPTDNVQTIKNKVEKVTNIPPAEQTLMFQGNKELEDTDTLEEVGINDDDELDLLDNTGMKIVVYSYDGRDFPMIVTPNDTIDELKEKILKKSGIPLEDQRLHFNGKLLKAPKMTLEKAGIKDMDCLDLEGMTINVKIPGRKVLPFEVTPEDTIESLKKRLEQRVFVAVVHQRLIFDGDDMVNTKTLRENNIKHGSMLNLKGMTIWVQMPNNGDRFSIKVIPTWRVWDVKKEISHVRSPECKDIKLFKLSFKDTELLDASRGGNKRGKAMTITDYGVMEGDTLDLTKIPLYDVQMTNWLNPFEGDFQTKAKIKREGRRNKHSSQKKPIV